MVLNDDEETQDETDAAVPIGPQNKYSNVPGFVGPQEQGDQGPAPTAPGANSQPLPEKPKTAVDYMVTPEELQANRDYQKKMALIGAIGDNLGNRQSFGNFFLGQMNKEDNSVSDTTKKLSDINSGRITDKQKMAEQELNRPSLQLQQDLATPGTSASNLTKSRIAFALDTLSSSGSAASRQSATDLKQQMMNPKISGFQANELISNRPEVKEILAADASYNKLAGMMNKSAFTAGATDQRLDRRIHQQVMNNLNNNKDLNQKITSYNNLNNSLSLLLNTKHLTPQQIREFQQAVRGNLGIKGSGGVGEREATYFDDLGLHADAWKQFLTGNPADIAKDSSLVQHLRDLAGQEQSNIGEQFNNRIDQLTSGNESMYDRRPDLRQDLLNKVKNTKGMFKKPASLVEAETKERKPNPQHTVQPEEKNSAIQWIVATLKNPQASPEDKKKAMMMQQKMKAQGLLQ